MFSWQRFSSALTVNTKKKKIGKGVLDWGKYHRAETSRIQVTPKGKWEKFSGYFNWGVGRGFNKYGEHKAENNTKYV